ncbi:MAG: DUF1838 domain-containing protein [Rhodospirillaceae bacterium]|nr:DUF1838 domain-containing protein [Rhodospirillaceae bacterium]
MTHIRRRNVLSIASSLTAALAGARTSWTADMLDLADPTQSLLAFSKLTGNSAGGIVYRWHTGIISAVQPGAAPKALVAYDGIEKEVWSKTPDGGFTTAYFDIGYFKDANSGARLAEWKNPLTDEVVKVLPFRSGRFAATLKPGTPTREWQQRGDDVWVVARPTVAFPALLKSDQYPAESAGPLHYFSVIRTDRGRLSDLARPEVTSAPLAWSYTLTTVWLPWMRMAQRAGSIVWAGTGGKYTSVDDIPASFKEFLALEQPDYLTATEPWPDIRNMWGDYMKLHPPAAKAP